jgi:hypothetical protein
LRALSGASAECFFEHSLDALIVGRGFEWIFSQSMRECERSDSRHELGIGRLFALIGCERDSSTGESELAAMPIDAQTIA